MSHGEKSAYGFKDNQQYHYAKEKVSQVENVRWRGGSVRYVWDKGDGVVMERVGGEWEDVVQQLLKS